MTPYTPWSFIFRVKVLTMRFRPGVRWGLPRDGQVGRRMADTVWSCRSSSSGLLRPGRIYRVVPVTWAVVMRNCNGAVNACSSPFLKLFLDVQQPLGLTARLSEQAAG